jgi:hypothetical protein
MDKMTDARIRAWLKDNDPSVLDDYNRYLEGALSVFGPPSDNVSTGPEPLRIWLHNHHSEILEKIFLGQ